MPDKKPKKTNHALALISAAAIFLLFVLGILSEWNQAYWSDAIRDHFPAVIGLPMAAVAAFIVVVFLQQNTEGPIEFQGLGFKFKGPSGAVVLWMICFIVIAGTIKLLW